jgi:GAF domain-containing protein
VLQAISQSTFDLTSVLQTLVSAAARICRTGPAQIFRRDGEVYRFAVSQNATAAYSEIERQDVVRPGRGTIMGRALEEKRPVQILDAWKDPDYDDKEAARAGNLRTMIGVPLMRDGEPIGVFAAARNHVEPLSEAQVNLVSSFADQAVIAIENARLFDELQKRTGDLAESLQQQTGTAEVLQAISRSTFDRDTVLQMLVRTAAQLCDTGPATIFLREGDVFRWAASQIIDPAYLEHEKKSVITPGRGTLVGRVALARRPVHITDILEDTEYQEKAAVQLQSVRTALGVPMLRDGEPVGVFCLARHRVEPFTESQIKLVSTFADQAVIAIENTRLFNETKEALERQTATADVLEVINSSRGDLTPVFGAITSKAMRLCNATFGGIWLIDGNSVRAVAAVNVPRRFADFLAREPVALNEVFGRQRDRPFLHVVDLAATSAYQRRVPVTVAVVELGKARTLLTVPLFRAGQPIGIINLYREEVRPFTDKQIALVQSFAAQAVIAIENARLFNETREALERQTATSEILRIISQSPSDVTPVFDAIAERARVLCGALLGSTTRFDGERLHLVGYHGVSPEAEAAMRASFPRKPDLSSINGRCFLAKAPVQIADVRNDPHYQLAAAANTAGYRSSVAVPMLQGGDVIGVIAVTRREPGKFPAKWIDLLQTFADQAVIAIQNVDLFNETREALERQTATADILQVIASSPDDVRPVFHAIAERSNRLVSGLSTTVLTIDGDTIHLSAFTRTNPAADAALTESFPRKLSLQAFGESVSRGEVYRLPDTEAEPTLRELARLRGYRSMLFVPLLRDGVPIGMIGQTRAEPGPFADHHVEMLKTFADQAVIAIQNVRLFEEVQRRTRELSKSLDDLRTAQDRLVQTEKLASLGQLTAGIAHEIKKPAQFRQQFLRALGRTDRRDDGCARKPTAR